MRIVIVGGGKTGAYLADRLHRHHQVTVVEQRRTRVDVLRQGVPEVEFIVGDACEPQVLESAGAAGADLVIAVTGDDEDNLVVAMLTKVLEGGTVYARVNHPRNEWLFDKEWGVDVAVSSPAMLYGLIGRELAFGDVIPLLDLRADDVTVEEVRLPENAGAVGGTLGALALPDHVSVMAVLAAEGGVRPNRSETVFFAGDQILLLVQGAVEKSVILDAFGITPPAEEEPAEAGEPGS